MKKWVFAPVDEVLRDEVARRLDLSAITAAILLTRGVHSVEEARSFLKPSLDDLADPKLLPDMEKAVDTLCRHARDGSRIVIYGDYDVDGLCAVTMLLQFLRLAGLDPGYFVPERGEEGYGVHASVLRRLREEGAGLIVTVDCGVSSVEETRVAREIGLEMVITDHHEPSGELPEAAAVVNPKINGSRYPFTELAGVGVAFKLVWALAERLSRQQKTDPHFRKFLLDSMALVALGTIADVVPLVNENRIFAKFGLEALRSCELPGVQALMSQCRLIDRPLAASDVSYKLGPKLNVAGRMASAEIAMKLLLTDSYGEGEIIARELEELNRRRQTAQHEIMDTARRKIEEEISENDYVLVLAEENWPTGIIGIVASHIVEQYYRPTVMISLVDGFGRGSARSIPTLNMVEALASASDCLDGFGGHAQAAGIRLAADRLDEFRRKVNAYARTVLDPEDLKPRLDCDGEILLDSLSHGFVGELSRLAPFGQSAGEPVLVTRHVKLAGRARRVGASGKHLSFYIAQGETSFRCIAFGMGELAGKLPTDGSEFHVAYTPAIETYTGRGDIELRVRDIHLPGEDEP
ncbi:MAG TPA: single-stranded-DNA-specific exonuclease RecJ [Planctomycetota bacterium]|nr:single-stranded-DNA-specific exonuclease RecJ [Planctomycetota bacterium]